jgi:hypothetical protein
MDTFMLAIKQRFQSLETICCKIGSLITIHVIKITLIDFDGSHKVVYKYVPHLGKLDEHALILAREKCMQAQVKFVGHKSVHN